MPTSRPTPRFRVAANVGTRFRFRATLRGKALATHLPEDERAAMAERLNPIAVRGYDSALDERDYGIASFAVPIFGQGKRVIASISCSTSTSPISQDELVRPPLPLLRNAAGEIEAALGLWPALEASLRP